jgi:predicted GIY-YIG superfamily endonuclease
MYFVYMVRCADGTLYTGFARDPHARVRVHNSGKGAKYTRSRLPVALVYSEQCESLSAALKRERQLKPWSRSSKEALIAGNVGEAVEKTHDPGFGAPGPSPGKPTAKRPR